ncbi:MAG: GerAB/ArcD/ProY family transporter [Firmicutes bacterium]|nr:GerAB/ArcD/ProY family transporter [Bacillota bacterium]
MNDIQGNRVRLSPAMFFITMLTTLYGLVFLVSPWDAVERCGPSSYWAVLVSLIYMIPFGLIVVAIRRRFPEQNIFEAALSIFGKVAGRIINLLFLGFFLLHYGLLIRISLELILVYFLDRTPFLFLSTLFLAGIAYIAYDGLFSISRLAGFVAIPAVSIRLMMQFFALQGLNSSQLLPVFSASIPDYLKAGLSMVSLFNPIIGLLLIYPLLIKPRMLGGITFGLIGGNFLLLLLSVVSAVGVLGAPMITALDWPILALVRRVALPYLILNQIGPLFVIVWMTLFIVGIAFMFYFLGTGLSLQFSKLNYRLAIFGISIIILIEGIITTPHFINHPFYEITRQLTVYLTLGYPLLVYCGALIRGKKGGESGIES